MVLGTSTLSELSSLGPHNTLEHHTARVCSAARQSLVAGVDTPPEPGLVHAWVQRCNPSRSDICSLGGARVTRARLIVQWRRLTVS